MEDHQPTHGPTNEGSSKRIIIIFITVVAIIAAGAGLAFYMIKTKPKVQKAPASHQAPLIECTPVQTVSRNVDISVMGTVIPSASIDLKSKVGGEVIYNAEEFIPGGRFKKGAVILKIDPTDYNLDIKKKESLVHVARANLDLELGRQDVARGELELMQKSSGRTIQNNDLALRKPQLDQAKAQYESALADLEAARLNKDRTIIKAPFNCLVLSRNTHTGAQVSALEILATLVDTDAYWIEAAVPLDRLEWLTLPGADHTHGSPATIKAPGAPQPFTGEIIRIGGQLNEQSRLAKVIIRVNDPLGLRSQDPVVPLMLDDYVRVNIQGKPINDVFIVPRSLLRDNGQIWVYDDSRLVIRDIRIVWSDDPHVYIDQGLQPGDCVIQSNVSGAVDGMDLRSTRDPEPEQTTDKDKKP